MGEAGLITIYASKVEVYRRKEFECWTDEIILNVFFKWLAVIRANASSSLLK